MNKKSQFRRFALGDRVQEAIEKIGFSRPTPVQEKVIPLMLQKQNLMVEAATGTGKTAAYGLPLLSKLDTLKRSTQALIVVPSRELAQQVLAALRTFSTDPKLRIEAIMGGNNLQDSEKKIKSSPHVMVAVPGRLKDVLRLGRFDFFWRDIKYLILDEADKLVEAGFQELLDGLLGNIRSTAQIALFSATLSDDADQLVKERFGDLQHVKLSHQEAVRNIGFWSVKAPKGAKEVTLTTLLRQEKISQALVFCSHRKEVAPVANFLRAEGFRAESYHGMLDQTEREAVMRRFKHKLIDVLVATDLAARGLDVEELPAVIHFSWPDSLEVFMHRSGRTGRAGHHGDCYALSVSTVDDANLLYFQKEAKIKINPLEVKLPDAEDAPVKKAEKLIKLHLNRGKRDKIRVGDIVGFLIGQTGVNAEELGTIALYQEHALVDVTQSVARQLEAADALKIKGKTLRITRFTLDDRKAVEKKLRKKQIGVQDKKKIQGRKR